MAHTKRPKPRELWRNLAGNMGMKRRKKVNFSTFSVLQSAAQILFCCVQIKTCNSLNKLALTKWNSSLRLTHRLHRLFVYVCVCACVFMCLQKLQKVFHLFYFPFSLALFLAIAGIFQLFSHWLCLHTSE